MDKEAQILALMDEWKGCEKCPLHADRGQMVFGSGALYAQPGPIVLVGEAPGGTEDEDERAIPFVGAAGQILMEALLNLHLYDERFANIFSGRVGAPIDFHSLRELLHETFWFTNIVLCRPQDNRDPTTTEMKECWPRLIRELYVVDPILIIALGRTAFQFLTKAREGINAARGKLYSLKVPGELVEVEYPVFAAHHPSYVDRIQDFDEKDGVAATWFKDLKSALALVDEINYLAFGVEMPDRDAEVGG